MQVASEFTGSFVSCHIEWVVDGSGCLCMRGVPGWCLVPLLSRRDRVNCVGSPCFTSESIRVRKYPCVRRRNPLGRLVLLVGPGGPLQRKERKRGKTNCHQPGKA